MNLSKTQITWIGSKKYSADKLCNELNLIWTNTFTLLGIHFDVDLSRINFLNYDKKLVKIKSIIKQWSKRSLTPLGRLSIIKTLLISQGKNTSPSQFGTIQALKLTINTFFMTRSIG